MKKDWFVYILIIIVWLAYFIFSLNAPLSTLAKAVNLTVDSRNVVVTTICIAYLVIWLFAASVFIKLKRYAKTIADSPDGKAFLKIANGFGFLFLGLMIPQFFSHLSALRSYFSIFPWLAEPARIATNYAFVLLPLIAFYFIFLGTRALLNVLKITPSYRPLIPAFLTIIPISFVYLSTVFSDPYRQISPDPTVGATYYLPDPIIFLTLSIPYIIYLIIGVMVLSNLLALKNEQSSIYRSALTPFLQGSAVALIANIFLQMFGSFGVARIGPFGLPVILAFIYIILALHVFGYVLIVNGAKKLTTIETSSSQ